MNRPRVVSVIIPARNANATLGVQLEALAKQTYRGETEVLVVDNGSRVSPRQLVERFRSVLDVRVVDASAQPGQAFARNAGIAVCRGDFVAFCDADDVVAADWLEALVTASAHATIVTGPLITQCELNSWRDRTHRGNQTEMPRIGGRPFMWTCNGGAWRSALVEAGGFDCSLRSHEDVELSWRILDAGGTIRFVRDALVQYRVRSNPRTLFKQWYGYGRGEAALYHRYRFDGMARRPWSEALRYFAYVILRWPAAPFNDGVRNTWLMWSGSEIGRVAGSIRHRMIYL